MIVEMKGITKRFPGVVANDQIDFSLAQGEIHALLGENGAGKTTLMNILYGLYQPEAGMVYVRGKKVEVKDPSVAIQHGIGMVHQNFMLIPPFTVAENVVLGSEPGRGRVFLDLGRAREEVRSLSEKFGLYVDPEARVESISVGMQQRVEIIKALYRGAEILILDEPTAVLTPQEVAELAGILKSLVSEGKGVIFITHKLKEVMAFSDRVTVIRRGRVVGTVETARTSPAELARMMVGRDVEFEVSKGPARPGEEVLRIENLWALNVRRMPALRGISLSVRAGEIVGVAGIEGNGQRELVEVLAGLRPAAQGKAWVAGREMKNAVPREFIEAGVAYIPEDRQGRGLVADFSVAENLVLERYYQRPFARGIVLDVPKVRKYGRELMQEYDIRAPGEDTLARHLSGGNQQRVVVGRELSRRPRLLIASQPTRGLDVGATEFVHEKLVAERDAGRAVLLVSLELDEILALSDRVVVLYEGQIVGEVDPATVTEEELGLLMAGGKGVSVH